MNKRATIAIALLLGIALLFILYLSWPQLTGTQVILATRPVDPFDPLRGQYMAINYEISRIPAISAAAQGSTVYVGIKPDEQGIWRMTQASLNPPGGVFLRGKVEYINNDQMSVRYGIEQYFTQRGITIPNNNITVHAAVASSGRASIISLLHNNHPLDV